MGFWFMAGSGHVPWRYTASTSPAGPAAEVTGTDRKNMLGGEKKKKSTQTQRTKHSFSIFLSFFSFLTDFVKVSLGTKSETSTDVSWINVGFVRARRSCVRVCMCIA